MDEQLEPLEQQNIAPEETTPAETSVEASSVESAPLEGEAAPKPPEGPKRAWYVVHCYSGYENRVKKGLEQRLRSDPELQKLVFRIVVPTEEELDVR